MVGTDAITVFGANGFIGSEIVKIFASNGYKVRVAHKNPEHCDFLKAYGQDGQVATVQCDFSPASITNSIKNSAAVINCIGILVENKHRNFMDTHCYLPGLMAQTCKENNIGQFIHISALGIDDNTSDYAASKRAGEKLIHESFENVTILRPSIVFGAKDSFFNMFAKMARFLPFLPLIGGGKTLFQPVFVEDVAQAAYSAFTEKVTNTYELGGPDVASFKELLQKMKYYTGQKVALVPIPFALAKTQAIFLQYMPGAPLTPDQVISLQTDNVVKANAMNLSDLNVKPQSMDTILPTYLDSYK